MPKLNSYTPGEKMTNEVVKGQVSMVEYPLRHGYDTTQRYGIISPFFYHQGLEKDVCNNKSTTHVRTLPMLSPSYARLQMHKSYAFIPTSCILPNNWEKVKREPSYGDDIPSYEVGCSAVSPLLFVRALVRMFSGVSASSVSPSVLFRSYVLLESIFASKTLLSSLRAPFHRLLSSFSFVIDNKTFTGFNHIFDAFFSSILQSGDKGLGISFSYKSRLYVLGDANLPSSNYFRMPFSSFLDIYRFAPSMIESINVTDEDSFAFLFDSFVSLLSDIDSYLLDDLNAYEYFLEGSEGVSDLTNLKHPFNYEPLHAYHISVNCLYNDSQTDFVLDSSLYRGAMLSLYLHITSSPSTTLRSVPSFTYNGSSYLYDSLSGRIINDIYAYLTTLPLGYAISFNTNGASYAFDYLQNVLCFEQSLKFFDLITGGRTRAYSVGAEDLQITGNSVNPTDIAKSLVYQRARMMFSRVGNDIDRYMQEILSSWPGVDQYHDVQPLGDTQVTISGFEIENNTSEGQGNLVTRIDNQDTFGHCQYQVSLSGTLLGLCYFDCERYYTGFFDTFYQKVDRFDHFNPELQHTGDIPLNRVNVDMLAISGGFGDLPFSYLVKDGDYKQMLNIADGGFIYDLPSWEFLADKNTEVGVIGPYSLVLNSSYVRSWPSEFDRFFASLTHYVEGSRFHFIIHFDNDFKCTRNMIPKPELIY